MSHRARHQLLALPGIIFLVLFPIILSLWIAFLWAKSEVNNQLRTFAQLALDKSELVIRQADLVSDAAERYQGQVCTPAHQKRMLNIIRGRVAICVWETNSFVEYVARVIAEQDSPKYRRVTQK